MSILEKEPNATGKHPTELIPTTQIGRTSGPGDGIKQHIRVCTASDGARIAYAVAGSGPPLVKAANYLTHLEHDWNSLIWQHWWQGLSETHQLIRYDARGSGLSDWNVTSYSMDDWVRDLQAVVDALNLDHIALLGISQGHGFVSPMR